MASEITARVLAVVWLGAAVAACSSTSTPTSLGSTLVGEGGGAMGSAGASAAAGAPSGGRMSGPATDAAIGGMIGNRIGAALDDEDKRRAFAAQVQALEGGPSGAPVAWRNPDSGRYGSVVPGPKYQSNGLDCRQYTHTIYFDGKPQTVRGAACRGPNGSWEAA